MVRPVMVQDAAGCATLQVLACGDEVTVYWLGVPPLDGTFQATVAWPLPGVAETLVTGPGAIRASGALQEAVEPPLLPTQDQVQGPVPPTLPGVPALQRLAVGLVAVGTPLALPQAPLIGAGIGVTGLLGAEAGPLPALLLATTEKV